MKAAPRISLFSDRVAIIGATDSGKSELAIHLFERARCRRVFVDPKHSFSLRGVAPAYDVAAIRWTDPVIHVRPPWHDENFSNALYGQAFDRLRHALILTNEARGVSDSAWKGSAFAKIQAQGRELEIGHIVETQRPVEIRREAFTEATHVFLFRDIDDDDLRLVRRRFVWIELERLRAALSALPQHGFIWIDTRTRRPVVADPLPESARRHQLVFRRGAS